MIMRAIIFDPFSGASGDMIIASLIGLGADAKRIKEVMESAAGVDVEISKTSANGIASTRVNVTEKKRNERSYAEIVAHIEGLDVPDEVKKNSLAIFGRIAKAESKAHSATGNIHFHELGQDDAIADVVGACAAISGFMPCRIFCYPVSVGGGFVEFSHGKFPVPAPATLEILNDSELKWRKGPVEKELLTPTGAAILAHFASSEVPQFSSEKTGYGSGAMKLDVPNALRAVLGDADDILEKDSIEVLETNVDNVSGEILGNLLEELLASGARDVALIPVTMKKSRSGHIIQAIAKPEDSARLAQKIMEETGSLGVRMMPVTHRLIAKRENKNVKTKIGNSEYDVSVKIASDLKGKIFDVSAEFEDCKRAARVSGVPVREVMRIAEEKCRKELSG